jgi:hypothetical protein
MKRIYLILIISLIVESFLVYSDCCREDEEGTITCTNCGTSGEISISDAQNPNAYPDILKNDNFKPEYSQYVPEEYINQIPPEKLDPTAVKDKSKLTAEQLSYVGVDGEPNLNKIEDWSKLDKEALEGALSELTGKDIEVTAGNEPVNGEVTEEGFTMDRVESLRIGDIIVTGGEGIVYSNDVLTADHVDTFIQQNSISTNIDNLDSRREMFSVGYANSVMVGCVSFEEVRESKFTIEDGSPTAIVEEGNVLRIIDCSFIESEFESFSNESSITIRGSTYEISKGALKCSFNNATELAIANSSIAVEMGFYCFSCLSITPVGTYYYHEALPKDFGINVPSYAAGQRLCLRKTEERPENYTTLVDFIENRIELGGIVNYMRYGSSSLIMQNVYESYGNNSAVGELDSSFVSLEKLQLEKASNNSVSRCGNYEIIENSATRFARITHPYPWLVKEYSAAFYEPLISINERALTQAGSTKVRILAPGSAEVAKAELFMENYWKRREPITLMEHLE